MANPDHPQIPNPPPAMLARDTADMRAQLRNTVDTIAASWQVTLAADETGPGRPGYSGATVDAELAFALYREACRRGLHHTSVEAQAIADVARFVNDSDFASLDDEAAAERARIAGALIRRGARIMVSVDGGAATRCTVIQLGQAAGVAERLDGDGRPVPFRLDRFLVSWWLDRPDMVHVSLHVGDPARKAPPPAPPAAPRPRKPAAARKAPAKRRGKVR